MRKEIPQTVATDRLRLRRPILADAEDVFSYAGDVDVTRYMDWPRHQSVSTVEDWIADCQPLWESGSEFTWLITAIDQRVLGAISLRIAEYKADFGYVLSKRYWGCGFASESANAIVDLAANFHQLYRLWATCDIENIASARVLEKAGLEREGVLRSWAVRPNLSSVPRDSFVYSKILRHA